MLKALEATKRFGETVALDGLSLEVGRGEVVCLLGANGAGKTTTIQLFLGFLAADEGEVRVDVVHRQSDGTGEIRSLSSFAPALEQPGLGRDVIEGRAEAYLVRDRENGSIPQHHARVAHGRRLPLRAVGRQTSDSK